MPSTIDRWLLLTHATATLFLVGLIWFVQIVHYPLFDRVGSAGFSLYAKDHQRLTTWVVLAPMLVEAITAALLLIRPGSCSPPLLWVGLGLVIGIWLSTALLQVPRHTELSHGFEEQAYRLLVLSNWVRTIAWTARGALVLVLLSGAMQTGTNRLSSDAAAAGFDRPGAHSLR